MTADRARPRRERALRASWSNVASALGAELHEDGPALQWKLDHGTLTLVRVRADDRFRYQLRAPFWNPRGLDLRIMPTPRLAPLTRLMPLFFGPDTRVRDPELDPLFHIATRTPVQAQGLLREPRVRERLRDFPRTAISVRTPPSYPEGVAELYAAALGRSKDARAVRPLLRALDDPNRRVSLAAVRALGELGDARAVAFLIPLLGRHEADEELREAVVAALAELGADALARAFLEALSGDPLPLGQAWGPWREAVVEGLLAALGDPRRHTFVCAFRALAELGAVEALPVLRRKVDQARGPSIAKVCRDVIGELEALGSLPRPAASPGPSSGTLPRTVGSEGEAT